MPEKSRRGNRKKLGTEAPYPHAQQFSWGCPASELGEPGVQQFVQRRTGVTTQSSLQAEQQLCPVHPLGLHLQNHTVPLPRTIKQDMIKATHHS
jgi:hypothetical protein